jgi:protein-tyrosine phosphatase
MIVNMRFVIFFFVYASILSALAKRTGGYGLFLLWPALSCGLISLAYAGWGPRIFGKRADGTLPWLRALLHLPYLGATWMLWHIDRMVRRDPARHELCPGIWIGRRHLSAELPGDFQQVIDLTSEFSEPHSIRTRPKYRNFPILDGSEAGVDDLIDIARQIEQLPRPILIHCARGKGRTGMVAAALLLVLEKATTATDAIDFTETHRPNISLTRNQRKAVEGVAYWLRQEQNESAEYDASSESCE